MRPNAIRCISEELLGPTCHHVPIKESQCFISFSALSFQNSACRLIEPSIQLQAKVAPCNQLLDSTMGYCAGNPELSRDITRSAARPRLRAHCISNAPQKFLGDLRRPKQIIALLDGLKFTSFALRTALYSEWHWAHSKSAVPPWTGSRASVPSKPQSGHASFSSVGFRSLKRKARQIGGNTASSHTRHRRRP